MNKRLKLRIIELFDSQTNFAEHIKADDALVSRVLRGRRNRNANGKVKWAKLLQCRPEEIFDDSNECTYLEES
jgi:hypothetical protein